jgi:hypothetical protein
VWVSEKQICSQRSKKKKQHIERVVEQECANIAVEGSSSNPFILLFWRFTYIHSPGIHMYNRPQTEGGSGEGRHSPVIGDYPSTGYHT